MSAPSDGRRPAAPGLESRRAGFRHHRKLRVSAWAAPLYTIDVGPGGFSVELSTAEERPGARVEGTIRVARREIPFQGVVAWVRPGDRARGRPGRVGVRFTALASEVRRLLGAASLPDDV